MKKLINIIVILYMLIYNIISINNSLSASTILLPIMSIGNEQVSYDLFIRGEEGCYKIITTRDDLANIKILTYKNDYENDRKCIKSIRIIPTSIVNSRDNFIISFIDRITGVILKSYILFRYINKLEIVTRRRILHISDVRERIEVIAYDEFGNIHTSLRGVYFEWSLKCVFNEVCMNRLPLTFVSFRSSNYEVDDSILEIESKGFKGNIILIEALYRGDVELSVKLIDPSYNHINHSIVLSVRENIVLDPSDQLYIIVGAYIHFQAYKIIRGKMEHIQISSKTYQFTLSNNSVASFQKDTSTLISKSIGNTIVSLVETNLNSKEVDPYQVIVHVINPTHITLNGDNLENWIALINSHYIINIQFYHYERLLNVSNLYFNTNISINGDNLKINKSDNQQKFSIFTLNPGISEITIFITSFISLSKRYILNTPLTAVIQIEIVHPIVLQPNIIIAPLLDDHYKPINYSFTPIGGTGRYQWYSLPDILNINPKDGIIRSTNMHGNYNVTCIDRGNKEIKVHGIFKVLPIELIKVESEYIEYPIESVVILDVKLFVRDELNQIINVDIPLNEIIDMNITDDNFKKCSRHNTSFCLIATKHGCTDIHFSILNFTEKVSKIVNLCVFDRMKVYTYNEVAIPGSFISLHVIGGPSSLYARKSKPETEIKLSLKYFSIVSMNVVEIDQPRIEIFKLVCIKPGLEILTFLSSTQSYNKSKHMESLIYNITCIYPSKVKLKLIPFNNDSKCLDSIYSISISKNYIPFKLYVNGYFINDLSGLNISLFRFPLKLLTFSVIYVKSPIIMNENISGLIVLYPNSEIKFLNILMKFKAKLSEQYIFYTSFTVNIVSNIYTIHKRINILNVKLNERRIKIYGGSKHIQYELTHDIIDINLNNKLITITPKLYGFSTIILRDLCTLSKSTKLEIFITSIKEIRVLHNDKVETNISLPIEIGIYTDINELISIEEQYLLKIEFRLFKQSPYPEIIRRMNNNSELIYFSLFSSKPIVISFIVEIYILNKNIIQSSKRIIEIYIPVHILPNIINLIPGMGIRLSYYGGPQINVISKFSINSTCLSIIDHNRTLVGNYECNEKLVLEIYSINDDNMNIIHSIDFVVVTVSEIVKIEIDMINNKFYEWTKIAVLMLIYNKYGQTSLYYSISNKYKIKWNLDTINYAYIESENNYEVILYTTMQGSFTISLELVNNKSILKTSKLIYVIRDLTRSSILIGNILPKILLPINCEYDLSLLWLSSYVTFKFADLTGLGFYLESSGKFHTTSYTSYTVLIVDIVDTRQDISHHQICSIYIEVEEISLIYLELNYNTSLYHQSIFIGDENTLNIIAIDSNGNRFLYIPSNLLNITIFPYGVIEVIELKNNQIIFKAVSIGRTTITINNNIKTIPYIIDVNVPLYIEKSINLHIGDIINYEFVLNEYNEELTKIVLSNSDIITYSKISLNSVFILGLKSGELTLQILYKNIIVDLLLIKVIDTDLNFVSNVPYAITDDDRIYIYFDISTNSYINDNILLSNNILFDKYPHVCKYKSNMTFPLVIRSAINVNSGRISCLLVYDTLNIISFPSVISSINISVMYEKYSGQFRTFSKIIHYLPKLQVLVPYQNSLIVDSCEFILPVSIIQSSEILNITSSLECIQVSYYINIFDECTSVILKLHSCSNILYSDKQIKLNIHRISTNQILSIPLYIKYHQLKCMSNQSYYMYMIQFIVTLICILLGYFCRQYFMVFCNYLYRKCHNYNLISSSPNISNVDNDSKYHPPSPSNINLSNQYLYRPLFGRSSLDNSTFNNISNELYTTRKGRNN